MEKTELVCLVRRAQCGDTLAFDALLRRFQDPAVLYARSLLRFDRAAAEDAAQEAFVQAWRDLPALKTAEAFPAWLRRIVFKYCDRVRRTAHVRVVPLDEAFHIAGGPEPTFAFEANEDNARLRDALEALPDREREAALLYYRDNHDLAEISAFLGIPRTTVKSRLHAARKRLRKELWEMAEQILEREKPSRNEAFVGNVLTRVMDEFRQQMRADPHTADRSLLTEGRKTLDAALAAPEPLDWETVWAGYSILQRLDDRLAIVSLLMRYLTQTLDDSHAAWAYLQLTRCTAWAGSAAAAVLAYEAFDRWLPGKAPRLEEEGHHKPALDTEAGGACYEGPDEIRMLVLACSGEFATAWRAVWRENDYLAMVNDMLQRVPPSDHNRQLRFSMMRMAYATCQSSDRIAEARAYIDRMYALAEESENADERAHWRAKAIEHNIGLCRHVRDMTGIQEKAQEMIELLAEHENSSWALGERHDLGCQLTWEGRPDLALPLFEQNLRAGGHANAWGYLMHAAALYQVQHDRERTLTLLRDAAARDWRDLTDAFQRQAEFADVKDDPEFLAAVRKPQ